MFNKGELRRSGKLHQKMMGFIVFYLSLYQDFLDLIEPLL